MQYIGTYDRFAITPRKFCQNDKRQHFSCCHSVSQHTIIYCLLQETGVYIPQQNRQGGPRPPMNGSLGAPWKPGVGPTGGGSFGDFFGMPPQGMMGTCCACKTRNYNMFHSIVKHVLFSDQSKQDRSEMM